MRMTKKFLQSSQSPHAIHLIVCKATRRLQRDVVCLCWPVAPLYTIAVGWGGGGPGSQPMSAAVLITWHGAKINFTSIFNLWRRPTACYCCRWRTWTLGGTQRWSSRSPPATWTTSSGMDCRRQAIENIQHRKQPILLPSWVQRHFTKGCPTAPPTNISS